MIDNFKILDYRVSNVLEHCIMDNLSKVCYERGGYYQLHTWLPRSVSWSVEACEVVFEKFAAFLHNSSCV